MSQVPTIINYCWIGFIGVVVAQALKLKSRSKIYIAKDPALKIGYKRIFNVHIVWNNIPFILMGIGIISGKVSSLLNYLRPSEGNPIVAIFFISMFINWIVSAVWIFFLGGAKFLVKHPGLFRFNISYPWVMAVDPIVRTVGAPC